MILLLNNSDLVALRMLILVAAIIVAALLVGMWQYRELVKSILRKTPIIGVFLIAIGVLDSD